MKEKLNGLVNQAHELNKQMYQTLLQIVQSHGGFIRTDDDNKFGMYAILMNEFSADLSDERILGVAVFGTYAPSLCVLVVGDYDYSDGELTSEDMLEDSHWLDVYGDGIVTTPTLIELCNGIYDFIEQTEE
jgi:hypothetical protein